jgi:L-seryl-tRNA(Ser) seleniumtransferase
LPPKKNLTEILATGADLAVFSGGKGFRGPQASGLIIGTPELVEACRVNSAPNGGPARGHKVGKEEIMGLVAAVEMFVEMDEAALFAEWHARIAVMKAAADGVAGVTASTGEHFDRPNAEFAFDAQETAHTAASVREALAAGTPSIVAGGRNDVLVLDPHTLHDGEDMIVAARVRDILMR